MALPSHSDLHITTGGLAAGQKRRGRPFGAPSSPLPYCCWVLLECDRLKPIPLLDSAKRPAT